MGPNSHLFQMYTVHFIDILFSNIDRHTGNYGFILNEDNTGTLVILDNGDFLKYLNKATRPLSFNKANALDYARYSKEYEFRYFITNCNESVKQMINSLINIFSLERISSIMDTIEKENNHEFECKKRLLKSYFKNYLMIKKVILLENAKREILKIH